jgi:hypothetical protein
MHIARPRFHCLPHVRASEARRFGLRGLSPTSGTPNGKSWPCARAHSRTDSPRVGEVVAVRYRHRRHERPEEVSPVLTTVGWLLPSTVARRST